MTQAGVKGVVLIDLNTKTIFISRHVTYHEHVLPYHNFNPSFTCNYHSTHVSSTSDISTNIETEHGPN